MQTPLRILIADDHAIVRQGLKLLIDNQPDMQVVAEAADGKAALALAASLTPDLVVMDISMPGMNGLVAALSLKAQQPDVKIVALTRHEDDTYLEELLRAGASAYVLKQSAPADFLKAIRAVAAGGIYLDPMMTHRVADGLLAPAATVHPQTGAKLHERESEVLRLVAVGHSNAGIAAQQASIDTYCDVIAAHASRE